MNAIARLIVRCYPTAWRQRYEDEVLALIETAPVRIGDVCGLLRGAITERVLSLYEPGRHITAYRFISGVVLMAWITVLSCAFVVVGAIPFALGHLTQRAAGPVPHDWVDTIAWWLLPAFLLVIVPAWFRLWRLQLRRSKAGGPHPPEVATLRWIVICGHAVLMFLRGLQPDQSALQVFQALSHSWILLVILWEIPEDISLRWPGAGLFEALGRLRSARHDLRWARMELMRCEGMYDGRDPGPELRAARAEMGRLTTAEADALAELDAMSYHARFQR